MSVAFLRGVGCEVVWNYSRGLSFTLSSDGTYYIVTGIGTCRDECITVPPKYKSKPVKEIGDHAFAFGADGYCPNIMVLPSSIIRIGDGAFYECAYLTHVIMGEGLKYIGGGAFAYSGIEELKIPTSVTSVENSVFEKCSSLERIYIPKSINRFPKKMFANCTSLSAIEYEGTQTDWDKIEKEIGGIVNEHWNYGIDIGSITITYNKSYNASAIVG